MGVKRFEDLNVWQEARILVKEIYNISKTGDFSKDFGLTGQIQRAAVSIMNNIAEGFDSDSNAEFIRFLTYARRSASEVQCNLYVALDQKYIKKPEFDSLYEMSEKTRRMITALKKYLKSAKLNTQTRKRVNA
ncbi:MAG: four helix bundle protein [Candidatus Omnitrophota bacterium]